MAKFSIYLHGQKPVNFQQCDTLIGNHSAQEAEVWCSGLISLFWKNNTYIHAIIRYFDRENNNKKVVARCAPPTVAFYTRVGIPDAPNTYEIISLYVCMYFAVKFLICFQYLCALALVSLFCNYLVVLILLLTIGCYCCFTSCTLIWKAICAFVVQCLTNKLHLKKL